MGIDGIENLKPDNGAVPQMLKYRRKPHDVEAMQFDGTIGSFNKIDKWIKDKNIEGEVVAQEFPKNENDTLPELVILVMGVFPVREGDWVIVRGDSQIAPAKGPFFKDNYEPIED